MARINCSAPRHHRRLAALVRWLQAHGPGTVKQAAEACGLGGPHAVPVVVAGIDAGQIKAHAQGRLRLATTIEVVR